MKLDRPMWRAAKRWYRRTASGTYTPEGITVTSTRTGGSSEGFPYLLAPGRLGGGGRTLTLLYGGEGPGSDKVEAVFAKDD
jgi:hypothetical protein